MNVNMVILAGRLTRDIQLSFLPSQTPVAEFGIATNKRFKKQDGSKGEKACFVDCKAFGAKAEAINKYFKKGDEIYIAGSLDFEQWDAQDGTKRSKLRVLVESFEFVGGKKNSEPSQREVDERLQREADEAVTHDGMDDDIPF